MPLRAIPSPLGALLIDAGGTLLEERRGRATLYAEVAHDEGLAIDVAAMGRRMRAAAVALGRRHDGAFRYGRAWFESFIERIFVDQLDLPRARLLAVQEVLFTRFADPAEYVATRGAHELLARANEHGVPVGVVSNWSEALPGLLEGLDLRRHLSCVLVSACEELEKPQRAFFERALAQVGAQAHSALHVGNDPELDVQGALAAGILPVLVGDAELGQGSDGVTQVPDLATLSSTLFPARS